MCERNRAGCNQRGDRPRNVAQISMNDRPRHRQDARHSQGASKRFFHGLPQDIGVARDQEESPRVRKQARNKAYRHCDAHHPYYPIGRPPPLRVLGRGSREGQVFREKQEGDTEAKNQHAGENEKGAGTNLMR